MTGGPGRRRVRVVLFGTYDLRAHPRVQVLKEGFAAAGDEVVECNVPLGLDTAWRVRILQRPWLAPVLAVRLAAAWARLWRRARRLGPVDAVVVGYLGHADVHLARRLWPRTPIALDHLISLADTARDRRVSGGRLLGLLDRADRAAVAAADVPFVDTDEHLALLPEPARGRALVVAVGAPERWFAAGARARAAADPSGAGASRPLTVAFFGLYTPLQGAPVIGAAVGRLAGRGVPVRVTMVGSGQDLAETRQLAGAGAPVRWRDWVDPDDLPGLVAAHDVCLGIFSAGDKARRVVPNKVFQGAAAGCAVVTGDTAPQRAALADAAEFVVPGDPDDLASSLAALAADRGRVARLRRAARERAEAEFRPARVVAPLRDRLLRTAGRARPTVQRGTP